MPTRYPTDRFDRLPPDALRVGAHRAPARRGRAWIVFAWAALATGLLVAAGIIGLTMFSASINLPFRTDAGAPSAEPDASASVPPTAEPVLDASLSITVLNGTGAARLANTAADALVAAGWCGATGVTEVEEGPCAGQSALGTRADAEANDIPTTVVYYGDAANEGAARALVQSLGVGDVALSDVYPESPLTVVLGADYVPPAG